MIDEDSIIICLGFGCRKIDEIVEGIRRNDKENDYTKDWSTERLYKHFYDIVEKDKNNFEFCINNNIKYYDTYVNRKELFDKIMSDLDVI